MSSVPGSKAPKRSTSNFFLTIHVMLQYIHINKSLELNRLLVDLLGSHHRPQMEKTLNHLSHILKIKFYEGVM